MGLITLFLQRMGPPLTNELGYKGKKVGTGEEAERPCTTWHSMAPRGPEREKSVERPT